MSPIVRGLLVGTLMLGAALLLVSLLASELETSSVQDVESFEPAKAISR